MTIPTHLDSFVTDRFIFEPNIGIHKSTGEQKIITKVIDCIDNRIVEVKSFDHYDQYLQFVEKYMLDHLDKA